MNKPARNTTIALGILLMGCAILIWFTSAEKPPTGNERTERAASTGQAKQVSPGRSSVDSTDGTEPSEEIVLTGRTKVRERPVETPLDKKRRERNRLIEELESIKSNGLGERHPARIKVTADLKKVEDELKASGDVPTPNK
jgi:hypothetical protein